MRAGPALRDQAIAYPHRHGRACPGQPRLSHAETETWMPGTRPGMTSLWTDRFRRELRPAWQKSISEQRITNKFSALRGAQGRALAPIC
ncbi:hypothetical protein E3H11_06730 [Bradyrhizobium brasilense]|nr:hypothetical protein [Bradyrhizobium brasilense]